MNQLWDDINGRMQGYLALPVQASDMAREIDHLHYFVITTTMLGSAVVFIVAIFFGVRYRRQGIAPATPRVRASLPLEISVFGGLLALFVLWWVIGFRQFVRMYTPPEDAQDVYVTGKQWMWKFSYPEGRNTVGLLVVPQHRDVRLLLTSRDVIHSFFVPALRVKRDALPGNYTSLWFRATRTGTYTSFCTEYCGLSHSRMWADLVVLTPPDYARWLEGDTPELVAAAMANAQKRGQRYGDELLPTLVERGKQAAGDAGCLGCHTTTGEPHIGPSWYGLYRASIPLQDGESVIADERYLTESMMDPLTKIREGYPPVMPSYRGILAEADASAIVAYIKSLRDAPDGVRVELPAPDTSPGSQPRLRNDGTPPAGRGGGAQ